MNKHEKLIIKIDNYETALQEIAKLNPAPGGFRARTIARAVLLLEPRTEYVTTKLKMLQPVKPPFIPGGKLQRHDKDI